MPGHDVVLPADRGGVGGARSWLQRSKVSMMIMRPPQQGQGGRAAGADAAYARFGFRPNRHHPEAEDEIELLPVCLLSRGPCQGSRDVCPVDHARRGAVP